MHGCARSSVSTSVAGFYLDANGKLCELGARSQEGSGSMGTGVALDLTTVPNGVTQIFVTGTIHAPASLDWKLLNSLRCRIVDAAGMEAAEWHLGKGLVDGHQGLIVGRLFCLPHLSQRWSFQAVGRSVDDADILREIQGLCRCAPSQLVRTAAPKTKRLVDDEMSSQASTCASFAESPLSTTPSCGSPRLAGASPSMSL